MLNDAQRRVVEHFGRPLLVVAGAGSGKTKTLAHKVEFLISERSLPAEGILCLTFTNRASKEIRERVLRVTGRELRWAGTFHSVALRILKHLAGYSFSVADESDVRSILKEVMQEYGVSEYEKIRRMISAIKEDLRSPADPRLRELFESYQSRLRENGLFDFGDLMYELYLLLRDREELRSRVRELFRFVLVDEYQDTNTVQYEILKLIADREICVVGDPNQCIYEWRFARPDNVLRFMEEFNPDVIKLETNYRSGGYILEVANAVLRGTSARWRELIPRLAPSRGMGEKPLVRRFGNPQEEAIWIGQELKSLLESYPPEEVAILVRVSHITDVLEKTLFRMGLPYRVVGTLRFYERAEIKNLICLLRLLLNPSDEIAFRRVVSFFTEGVGQRTLTALGERYRGDWIETLRFSDRTKALRAFVDRVRDYVQDYPRVLEIALEESPYLRILERRYRKDFGERLENVKELLRSARESYREGITLEEFVNEAALSSAENEHRGVSIMTVHAAKGLEFSAVFLPRLEEGILPHRSALEDPSELEEERRLFYVAVTRAKEKLYLSYTREGGPSRFLSEIPKKLLNLEHFRRRKTSYSVELKPNSGVKVGTLVSHRVFGVGRVLSVSGESAEVDFRGKVKRIHTAFLETLD